MEKAHMNKYEIGYVVAPLVAESEVALVASMITSRIGELGGTVLSSGEPKMRELAYSIEKRIGEKNQVFHDGYFGHVRFEISPEKVNEYKETVSRDKNIIRSMIVSLNRHDFEVPMRAPRIPLGETVLGDTPAEVVAQVA